MSDEMGWTIEGSRNTGYVREGGRGRDHRNNRGSDWTIEGSRNTGYVREGGRGRDHRNNRGSDWTIEGSRNTGYVRDGDRGRDHRNNRGSDCDSSHDNDPCCVRGRNSGNVHGLGIICSRGDHRDHNSDRGNGRGSARYSNRGRSNNRDSNRGHDNDPCCVRGRNSGNVHGLGIICSRGDHRDHNSDRGNGRGSARYSNRGRSNNRDSNRGHDNDPCCVRGRNSGNVHGLGIICSRGDHRDHNSDRGNGRGSARYSNRGRSNNRDNNSGHDQARSQMTLPARCNTRRRSQNHNSGHLTLQRRRELEQRLAIHEVGESYIEQVGGSFGEGRAGESFGVGTIVGFVGETDETDDETDDESDGRRTNESVGENEDEVIYDDDEAVEEDPYSVANNPRNLIFVRESEISSNDNGGGETDDGSDPYSVANILRNSIFIRESEMRSNDNGGGETDDESDPYSVANILRNSLMITESQVSTSTATNDVVNDQSNRTFPPTTINASNRPLGNGRYLSHSVDGLIEDRDHSNEETLYEYATYQDVLSRIYSLIHQRNNSRDPINIDDQGRPRFVLGNYLHNYPTNSSDRTPSSNRLTPYLPDDSDTSITTDDDLDLKTPTDEELQFMTEPEIRERRVEQSRVENMPDEEQTGAPCDVEDPVEVTQNEPWKCVICQEGDCGGQFVVLEGCRHLTCAKCFEKYIRTSWNQNRVVQEQRPMQLRCCHCRRPVRLWARSSRLLTHGSQEKDNLMRDEIQRRLKAMRQGMTHTEWTSGEASFGPIEMNEMLWATDGWFAMYFGHMENELRVAGFFDVAKGASSPGR